MADRSSPRLGARGAAPAPIELGLAAFALAIASAGWAILHRAPVATFVRPPSPPYDPDCGLWFVGSSSIARWDALGAAMAPWHVDNRGVPGATLGDVAEQMELPDGAPPPRGVIVYGGDNDLAAGQSPEDVIEGFAALAARKAAQLGDVPLFVISLKPSPARWTELPEQREVNAAIRALADERDDLVFVDVAPRMTPDGRPGDFYDPDGVHLNDAGYRVWTGALKAALRDALPRRALTRCGAPGAGA